MREDDPPPPPGLREIPGGAAPARRGSPVAVAVAALALACGLVVQAHRVEACRARVGGIAPCLLAPVATP